MILEATRVNGTICALINNAGIGSFMDVLSPDAVKNFDKVIGINLRGSFMCAKVLIRFRF